jgi:hypothetical protein
MSAYDPSGASDTLKNVFGAMYVVLLVVFGYRLFTKRAKTFTEEVGGHSRTDRRTDRQTDR